ncbi:MAG: DUF488 domain-containing protein [Paludibacteraceae bacterium]|nr:DUF488 domain-containing protein [Paludibacteraceae bacterium]
MYPLYTIGHSNQSFEEFAEILQAQKIDVIVDVRSVPASKYTPQFNKEPLSNSLKRLGINYLSFAKEFGARRTDALDKDNNVDFEKAVQTTAFFHGVERLLNGLSKGYRISLMCSEADPIECHRFAMISRYFYEHGIDVCHIIKEKDRYENMQVVIRTHRELQDEMVAEYVRKKKIPLVSPPDIFGQNEVTKELQISLAYQQKNREIAYHQQTEDNQYPYL